MVELHSQIPDGICKQKPHRQSGEFWGPTIIPFFFLLLNKRKCLCGAKFQASVACELASSLYLFLTMSFLPKLLLPLEDYTKLRLSLIYILYMLPLRCFYATFPQLMQAPA